jgi:hypothetical protein
VLLWLDEKPESFVEVKCSAIPGYSFKIACDDLAADTGLDSFVTASTFSKILEEVDHTATAAVSPVLQHFEILHVEHCVTLFLSGRCHFQRKSDSNPAVRVYNRRSHRRISPRAPRIRPISLITVSHHIEPQLAPLRRRPCPVFRARFCLVISLS